MVFYGAILGIAAKCISGKSFRFMPIFCIIMFLKDSVLGCLSEQLTTVTKLRLKKLFHIIGIHSGLLKHICMKIELIIPGGLI